MSKKLINIAGSILYIGLSSFSVAKESNGTVIFPALSLKMDTRFDSEYVYRGAKLGYQVFVPKVEVGASIFEKGCLYFGNQNFLLVRNSLSNRHELYAGLSYDVTDIFTVDFGFRSHLRKSENITLQRQGGKKDTKEIYIGLLPDVCCKPSLYYSYDTTWERHNTEGKIHYLHYLAPLGMEGFAVALLAKAGYDKANKPLGMKHSFELGGRHHGKKRGYVYYGAGADLVYFFRENCEWLVGIRYEGTNTRNVWIHGPSAWLFTIRKNLAWFSTSVKWNF
jgi:hypothetical protein